MALTLTIAAQDVSNYIAYGSVSLKLNTLDIALIDAPFAFTTGNAVTLSASGDFPDWSGTTSAVKAYDLVDRATGHALQVITATNTGSPTLGTAPFDLSDAPSDATTSFELEDGSGHITLESGTLTAPGAYLTEGAHSYGYRGLAISNQLNTDTSTAVLGECTLFHPGLWPGLTFQLASANLNGWIVSPPNYTLRTITVSYQGANPPTPVYQIEFGDLVQTLAEWTFANGH